MVFLVIIHAFALMHHHPSEIRSFVNNFLSGSQLVFTDKQNVLNRIFFKNNFSLYGQSRPAKSSSHPVNLPVAGGPY